MSDVRRDIERAAQNQSNGVSTDELIKWGAGISGGAILGTLVGRKIKKMVMNRKIPNIAMRTTAVETARHNQRVRNAFRNRK